MIGFGFSILFLAIQMHDLGTFYEIVLTITGAAILITSHLINMRYFKN